jgi:hypothetical protein
MFVNLYLWGATVAQQQYVECWENKWKSKDPGQHFKNILICRHPATIYLLGLKKRNLF